MPVDDPASKENWQRSLTLESWYGIQLRKIARAVADAIAGNAEQPSLLEILLNRYATAIHPWAESVSNRMLQQANLRDAKTWEQATRQMGNALKREIKEAPTGMTMRRLQRENVDLITSLPRKASLQVHELTLTGQWTGERASERAKEIQKLGPITKARATLIARTETGRASSLLMQARAEFIGSEGYIWRTMKDEDVRLSHQVQEGKFIRWDSPPKTDKNLAPYHAGCGPNCRCYPEPVIPNKF